MTRTSTVAVVNRDSGIRIETMPSGKAVEIAKAVRIDKTVVFLGKDGNVYCPRLGAGFFYGVSVWQFSDPLFRGLVKLGLISKKQADDHLAEAKRRDSMRSAHFDLKRFDEIAKKYGLKVPVVQRAKIERVVKKGGAA